MSGAHTFMDEEAGEDSDEDGAQFHDSSEEEADEEDQLSEEGRNFLADEDEDEEEEEEVVSVKKRSKKRKRSKRPRADDLDDDDLALVAENTGKQVTRRPRLFKPKDSMAPVGRDGLAQMFDGDGDGQDLEDDEDVVDPRQLPGRGGYEYEGDESDEMEGFIEHDAQDGAQRRMLARKARDQGISVDAAQELLDIFGSEHDTKKMLEVWMGANDVDGGEEKDGMLDERIEKQLADPLTVQKYHMTDQDELVRRADCPERLLADEDDIPDFNVQDATEHIYRVLFAPEAQDSKSKWLVEDGVLEVDGVPPEPKEVMINKYEGLDMAGDTWLHEIDTPEGPQTTFRDVSGFRLLRKSRQPPPDPENMQNQPEPAWCTSAEWAADEEEQMKLKESIGAVLRLVFIRKMEIPVLAMFYKESMRDLLCTVPDEEAPSVLTLAESEELEQRQVYMVPGAVTAERRIIRRWDILWAVYNEAKTYFALVQKKSTKGTHLEKSSIQDPSVKDALQQDLEAAVTPVALEDWTSRYKLAAAAFESGGRALKPKSLRDFTAKYSALLEDGLGVLAERLAMSADRYAQNIETVKVGQTGFPLVEETGVIQELATTVEGFVLQYTGTRFSELVERADGSHAQPMQEAAEFILVNDIACHPAIRNKVRELIQGLATLSTVPTEAGERVLSPFHKYGRVKRILHKPIGDLMGYKKFADPNTGYSHSAQYLEVHAAEKEGLLKVALEVPTETLRGQIIDPFVNLYTSHVDAAMFPALFEFRRGVVAKALDSHLLPMAYKHLREHLLKSAQREVLESYETAFWQEATTPPLRLRVLEEEEQRAEVTSEFVQGQRTCVICWGEERTNLAEATHMVMLDSRGYPLDVLQLPQFSGNIPMTPTSMESLGHDERKADDVERIVAFLKKHWPHLLVVGTSSPACRQLHLDLEKICDVDINQADKNDNLRPLTAFHVRLVKDNVAAAYEASAFADSDLKDYPRLVRRATALGRSCYEPLAVLSSLMSMGEEALSLHLHPMQHALPVDQRRRALTQLLCSAVAQVGVNLNECVQKDWLAPMLCFVPGMGPRKAMQLVKAIKTLPEYEDAVVGMLPSQTVVARDTLLRTDDADADDDGDEDRDNWRPVRILPKKVYNNAAPYLRICDPNEAHEARDDVHFNTKDDMRVLPRDEQALAEIARVAMDRLAEDETGEDAIPLAAVNRDKVMLVDLARYDERWQQRHPGKGSRLSSFIDISFELVSQYHDPRSPERLPLNDEELFWSLTGESPITLKMGAMVSARVVWVQPNVAGLRTDTGIECRLERSKVSTKEVDTLVGNLLVGAEVAARVEDIDFPSMRLVITSKTADLRNSSHWERVYCGSDPNYHVLTNDEKRDMSATAAARDRRRKLQHRPIQHARYANITVLQAREALTSCDFGSTEHISKKFKKDIRETGPQDGDAIFHPSPKGPDRLGMTMRLFSSQDALGGDPLPVLQNMDVLETKSNKMGTHLTLGTPLHLQMFPHHGREECEFEDLDDLLVNFVAPYVQYCQDILKHPKFVPGEPITVQKHLEQRFEKGCAEYRLGLYGGAEREKEVNRSRDGLGIGWGFLAYKLVKTLEADSISFRISHKGYYVKFPKEPRSILIADVGKLIRKMKECLGKLIRSIPKDGGMGYRAAPQPHPHPMHMQGHRQPQHGAYAPPFAHHMPYMHGR